MEVEKRIADLQIQSCGRGAMEMDVLPATGLAMPDSGLFKARDARLAVSAYSLVQANIRDDRDITHDANTRCAHRREMRTPSAAETEVKAVKLQALDELAFRLRLESGQARIA
jgi:hypothetical protein